MATDYDVTVWKRQKVWSIAAGKLKKSIAVTRGIVLMLWIGGAILETLSSQIAGQPAQKVLAGAGAVFLAVAAVLTHRMLNPDRMRAWVRARSASEALKADLYKFWAKAAPYDGVAGDAVECLRDHAEKIETVVDDLMGYTATSTPPDEKPPGPLTPDEYLARRVNQQIDGYYRDKASKNARLAKWFRAAEFVLAILAAGFAAVATVLPDPGRLSAWVAVLTTVGGAITAHMASCRFDFLVTSYLATARRLEDLRSRWPPSGGVQVPSQAWSDFVQRCETAISAENESWMAKWTQEDKKIAKGG